jgi:hypothetical protein
MRFACGLTGSFVSSFTGGFSGSFAVNSMDVSQAVFRAVLWLFHNFAGCFSGSFTDVPQVLLQAV